MALMSALEREAENLGIPPPPFETKAICPSSSGKVWATPASDGPIMPSPWDPWQRAQLAAYRSEPLAEGVAPPPVVQALRASPRLTAKIASEIRGLRYGVWGRVTGSIVAAAEANCKDPPLRCFAMPDARYPHKPSRRASDVIGSLWERICRLGTIGTASRRAARFGHFGEASAILFPLIALYGEKYMHLGNRVIIGPHCSISCGVAPDQELAHDVVLRIEDGVLIGRGSGIVAHESITIGENVFTGHNVYITDANHGYESLDAAIGHQFAPPRPVSIGAGSWLGHGTIVLPGAHIGEHVVIGAGSVVTGIIPDRCVAVGNPARVIRQWEPDSGWVAVSPDS